MEEVEDTQMGGASSSTNVLVKRSHDGPREPATEAEAAELTQRDADEALVEMRQAAHNESFWEARQAAVSQSWDDWAVHSEMTTTVRTRPLKKFRVRVSVMDGAQRDQHKKLHWRAGGPGHAAGHDDCAGGDSPGTGAGGQ